MEGIAGVNVSGIMGTATQIVSAILLIILFGGIALVLFYVIRNMKRYSQFFCVIFRKDAFGNIVEEHDKAGIFVDNKTKNKLLFLKSRKVALNPDLIPYIQKGKHRIIYFYQSGLKNMLPLKFSFENPHPFTIKVGEEDVNWAINSYEKATKMYMQDFWAKYGAIISVGFICVTLVLVSFFLVQKFDVISEASQNMVEATKNLAQAKAGTTVIGG
jgi:hypothetical protein